MLYFLFMLLGATNMLPCFWLGADLPRNALLVLPKAGWASEPPGELVKHEGGLAPNQIHNSES